MYVLNISKIIKILMYYKIYLLLFVDKNKIIKTTLISFILFYIGLTNFKIGKSVHAIK